MTSDPTVSVIIPAYNEAETIGVQLAALARQEGLAPTEVIVADNGSTDDTAKVVRSFQGQLPQLQWIVADRVPGPSHARNAGAQVATGEVLAFCDADDEADDRWLAELVPALQRADLVGGALETARLNSPESLLGREIAPGEPQGAGFLPTVITSNMAIRARLFREIGMFDESFVWGHDHEFSYRVQLAGHSHAHVPAAVVHYRIKTSTRSLMRREYQDSVGMAHVYAAYRRRGMPRRSAAEAARIWAWLLVHVLDLRAAPARARWVRKAAGSAGRLVGSLRFRVFYP